MKQSGLRIGLLGHGAMGIQHVVAFQALGCKINAVLGPDQDEVETFALHHGIDRWTTELNEVLEADDIDAVVVVSPNDLHAEQVIAAAEMGKHVMCEVPLATSLEDAKRVVGAIEAAGIKSMVCQTQRFYPSIERLRRLAERGEIEGLFFMSLMALRRRQNENTGFMGVSRNWIDNIVWHHGSHAVDTALWLLSDDLQEVQASCGRPDSANGRPLDISITLRTQSDRLAVTMLSYSSPLLIQEITLIAEQGTFRIKDGAICNDAGQIDTSTLIQVREAAVRAQDELFVRGIADEVLLGPTAADLLPLYTTLDEVDSQIRAKSASGYAH